MIWMTLIRFFKGISLKQILYGLAGLSIAFVVWQGVQFVDAKIEADKKIVQLEEDIDTYEETVRVLKESAAQKERADATADAVISNQVRLRFSYDAIRREAASTKEEFDAPLAPVLRRTLNALDGL